MGGLTKFVLVTGSLAAIGSLVMLIVIANHIANQIEETEEEEEIEKEDPNEVSEGKLVDVKKTNFPSK